MKRNLRAWRLNLLAAIVAFIFGTAAESLRFKSVVPQEKVDPAPAYPTQVDCTRPPFHTSNISRIASMLNQLAESKGTARTNTFYVQEVDDERRGGKFAQVYWEEDQSVMFISPPYDAENFDPELSYLKRINLKHDVVPTWSDVGTTNYLVPKHWIEGLIEYTLRNGVKITISNLKPGVAR